MQKAAAPWGLRLGVVHMGLSIEKGRISLKASATGATQAVGHLARAAKLRKQRFACVHWWRPLPAPRSGARAGATARSASGGALYALPMIDAVAISSSSSANDTLPDTAYGSSSGFSEYLSKIEWLILDRFTCPMVQPPNRRSEISS